MKKLFIVLAFLGLLASAVFAFYAFNQFIYNEKQGTGEVQTEETDTLESDIKAALVAKHGPEAESLTVTVSENTGDYARGSAWEGGTGGGMWFAARINEEWELVWDGNGIIACEDLEDYPEFPTDMIPSCYDSKTEEMVTR